MTHRQARRALGSRMVRRAGIRNVRTRSGRMRHTGASTRKARVAVLVRQKIAAAAAKGE